MTGEILMFNDRIFFVLKMSSHDRSVYQAKTVPFHVFCFIKATKHS